MELVLITWILNVDVKMMLSRDAAAAAAAAADDDDKCVW